MHAHAPRGGYRLWVIFAVFENFRQKITKMNGFGELWACKIVDVFHAEMWFESVILILHLAAFLHKYQSIRFRFGVACITRNFSKIMRSLRPVPVACFFPSIHCAVKSGVLRGNPRPYRIKSHCVWSTVVTVISVLLQEANDSVDIHTYSMTS